MIARGILRKYRSFSPLVREGRGGGTKPGGTAVYFGQGRPAALSLLLAVIATGMGCDARPTDPPGRLNVLFLVVDDLNTDLGCYGHPVVRSPQIDRLAGRGVRFDRAYCQYPLCNPSRSSFLSGRRPETTRVLDNETHPRTALGGVPFLPEYFHEYGYFAARVGKIAHGRFEDAVAWDVSEDADTTGGDEEHDEAKQSRYHWERTTRRDQDEPDGRTARRITELLRQHRSEPFFIAAGFLKPHVPFVAPRKYFALYPPNQIQLPASSAAGTDGVPAIALTRPHKVHEEQKRHLTAGYYACISFVDAQIGVILDALERYQLADRTVVVLVSDHGFHLGDHGNLWGKLTLFERSTRVPLIIAAPGHAGAGHGSARVVELIDIYPTLTELCELPLPTGLDGISVLPLLNDPTSAWNRAAFSTVWRGATLGRTVRSERFRYTRWGDGNTTELYDHDTDPHEERNLAGSADCSDAIAALGEMLDRIVRPVYTTSDVRR